ncbi:MAG: hypothetical protein ACYS0D_06985 [Planctomycetota bacterium]|jgi:T5SS/PEP-CTERM-associated repeat protein
MNQHHVHVLSTLALSLTITAAGFAGGTESYWLNMQFGEFHDPANWSAGVPDETVTAIFDGGKGFDGHVLFENGGDALSDRLIIRNSEVQLYLSEIFSAPQYTYDVLNPSFLTPSIVVGENLGETALLSIRAGALNGMYTVVGLLPGSSGTIEFDDFTFQDETFTPSLTNTYQLHVGSGGNGYMTIDRQAPVSNTDAFIGALPTGYGEVYVREQGTVWINHGTLAVGRGGEGHLTIEESGDVTSAQGIVGQQLDSVGEVTVDGVGATWVIEGPLDVGMEGNGTMTISNAALVINDSFATIGTFPEPAVEPENGGVGHVTVTGLGSSWFVKEGLYVTFLWMGTMDVLDGASVVSLFGVIGSDGQPLGAADIDGPGSSWVVATDIEVYGTLAVTDGGAASAEFVVAHPSSSLEGDGTILGDVSSSGVIRPGDPYGTLTIDGGLVQSSTSDLVLELAGTDPAEHGAIDVAENAILHGQLTVEMADGYEPQPDDVFVIVTAPNILGGFDATSLPTLAEGASWHVIQNSESVYLRIGPVTGDFNEDGTVSTADLLQLIAAWGPCQGCPEDLDGDGEVATSDLLILIGNWG